jgi:hypothetical protein
VVGKEVQGEILELLPLIPLTIFFMEAVEAVEAVKTQAVLVFTVAMLSEAGAVIPIQE